MRLSKAVAVALAPVVAASALAVPSAAVDLNKSRLTTVELKACRQVGRHRDGRAWICPGLPGYPVYVAEGDLRTFVAFGPEPAKRQSAQQTLGPFNTIFWDKRRPAIEWRMERRIDGKEVPFATILRYRVSRDGQRSEVLVVTKVDERQSCQLATIDTWANPDAMGMARAWAIAEAQRRTCPEQPDRLGIKGKLDP